MDSTQLNDDLNDDLVNGSEYSLSSYVSQPVPSTGNAGNNANSTSHHSTVHRHKRTGSTLSYRTSIDNESTFSSSVYFNILNSQPNPDDSIASVLGEYSPLGPNSIFELTVGSDTARARKNRPPKSSVTINGGLTTVSNLKVPTTKDIPQIQLAKLKVKVKDIELQKNYVDKLVEEYRSFESSYKQLTEDTLQKFTQHEQLVSQGQLSASSSITNFQDITEVNDGAISGELSDIPEVYLNPDFRLDDPRIFKQVIEGSSIVPKDNDDPASHLVNNTALQEKISHYLDVVEVCLIKEISRSSDSFFSTIGDIEKIQKQSKDCVVRFQAITDKLQQVEESHSKKGLEIFDKLVEKKNVEHLESSFLQLQYIVSIFELANKSFNNAKYSKCLTEIVIAENLIQGIERDQIVDEELRALSPKFSYPLVNLSSLPALVHLRNDLQTLKDECSKGYINDFIQVLVNDLRGHYQSVPVQDTLNRMYNGIDNRRKYHSKPVNNSYLIIDDTKKDQLIGFVRNLAKSGHLIQAYADYQERVITEIKDIIKINLPTSPNQNGSAEVSRPGSVPPEGTVNNSQPTSQLQVPQPTTNSSLSSNIKSLTPKEFETMFIKTYTDLSECLRRLTVHQKLLLDIALTAVPPALTQDMDIMSLDITSAINRAIELTQKRLTSIINVRSEQTADLTVPFYLRLNSITSAYLQECELISPVYVGSSNSSALGEWFKHHLKYFVHRFHSNSLKGLVADCSRDTWKEVSSVEALQEAQIVLNEIIGYSDFVSGHGSSTFSGDKWLEPLDFYENPENTQGTNGNSTVLDANISRLTIGNESFMIPSLLLRSLKQIRDYLVIAKVFPSTLSSIVNNLLNYFKLLNSKSSQAVLNAGATRTAGLKHIFPKHIALCIQLVEFTIALLDHLKDAFPYHETSPTPGGANVPQEDSPTFARIISNYKDHENELFSKLVSILHDRTITHCNTIKTINWSEPLKYPQQCHSYMETLVKDTTTVTKAISRYLPELKCSLILSQVFDNYKRMLVECYCTQIPQFKDFNEKHLVLKDIDYFRVKLCELPGYGNSGQVIWENVNSLPTEEDTKMDEVMRHNIEGERLQIQSARSSAKSSLDIAQKEQPPLPEEVTKSFKEDLDGQLKEDLPTSEEQGEAEPSEEGNAKEDEVKESVEKNDVPEILVQTPKEHSTEEKPSEAEKLTQEDPKEEADNHEAILEEPETKQDEPETEVDKPETKEDEPEDDAKAGADSEAANKPTVEVENVNGSEIKDVDVSKEPVDEINESEPVEAANDAKSIKEDDSEALEESVTEPTNDNETLSPSEPKKQHSNGKAKKNSKKQKKKKK
ncbi:Vps54-like protein-domain-containing protein [Scheffersomyces xylosifermentans]|uniref:Vps54-like protein-domain-containing protein n=1 Tax=Scheffersomyces xylosifermentans TaxID=1304137 RepID=UPI00315D6674